MDSGGSFLGHGHFSIDVKRQLNPEGFLDEFSDPEHITPTQCPSAAVQSLSRSVSNRTLGFFFVFLAYSQRAVCHGDVKTRFTVTHKP